MYGSIYGRSSGGYGAPSRNSMFGGSQRGFGNARGFQVPQPVKREIVTVRDVQPDEAMQVVSCLQQAAMQVASCSQQGAMQVVSCPQQAVMPAALQPVATPTAVQSSWPVSLPPHAHMHKNGGSPTYPQSMASQKAPQPPFYKIGYITVVFNSPTWVIPSGSTQGIIPFNLVTASSDSNSFNVPQSQFTASCKGLYHFDFVVEVQTVVISATNPAITVTLYINNLSRVPITYSTSVAGAVDTMTGSWQGILEAGDVVNLRANTQANGSGNVLGNAYANVLPYPTSLSAWWFPC